MCAGIQSIAFEQEDVFCLMEYSVVFYQEEVFCLREYRVLYLIMWSFVTCGNTECCF